MNNIEWLTHIKEKNMAFLHFGVESGWWDGVDERRGMPIPFPIIINLFNKPSGFLMAHALHEAGLFASITEARKAGWNKLVTPGEFWFFKRTKRLLLVYVKDEEV